MDGRNPGRVPFCHNCGNGVAVVYKPRPYDIMRGRYTFVAPAFECAACGERIILDPRGAQWDVHIPGAMIYANY